tara:strand:+ start:221 stop:2230 length:2010 start_codon:yes stop_codon:yes gene_type:complete
VAQKQSLFRRLTLLFRSGPVIKRRVKDFESKTAVSSAFEMFSKTQSHVYSTAMSAYGTYDRMARYSDFSEMEYTPEISSAIDIYAEETVAADEHGQVLHIYSENPTLQRLLDELFYDTLNIEFNATSWVRTLCKYGDFFLFNDVDPEYGVINCYPIPVNEIEREEGFDPADPMAVRFRWVTQGNQVLENWQVTHFRLLGNDAFLPYGSSVLEPARRIWRQMILAEDAMLVYRVVRSPERRVFYIDVGNVPPEDIPNYMEQAQTTLKRSQVVDKDTGRVDLRYNPLSVDEDYFLPVRGTESGTRIDTLPGGTNATAIEDVEYIQKKLFAALKIPKAYLGYDEGLGAKATLSQEDIRFSRTIARIQRTVIAELNKLAIIHLFCNGFEGEDLLDFKLKLSNPSTIAQQQKLELFRSRFEIAGTAAQTEGLVDKEWLRKNLFNMTDEDIIRLDQGRVRDRELDLTIESITLPDSVGSELDAEKEVADEEEGDIELSDNRNKTGHLLTNDIDISSLSVNDENAPITAQNTVDQLLTHIHEEDDSKPKDSKNKKKKFKPKDKSRRKRSDFKAPVVDLLNHTSHDRKNQSDSIYHPFGNKYDINNDARLIKNAAKMPKLTEEENADIYLEDFFDEKIGENAKITNSIKSTLKSLEKKISINRLLISETNSNSSEEA